MKRRLPSALAVLAAGSLLASACGSDEDGEDGVAAQSDGRTLVYVTTPVLGDVVANLACDTLDVRTVMPVGADPHTYQLSAQEANDLRGAELLIVNGASFEEGLLPVIESAEEDGLTVYEAITAVETIEFTGGHDDHEGEEDHEGDDPHFFTDPARMAVSASALADELRPLVAEDDLDRFEQCVTASTAELTALDAEAEEVLDAVPADQRVLITDHEVLGYFADRYGFEVVGVVIPGGSTGGGASARELAELAAEIEEEGVDVIFTTASAPSDLAETVAAEVGEVEVVALYVEGLSDEEGGSSTYVDMIRSSAETIAAALSEA